MMQVILLEKVLNVGELGETVKVKPGYARNYLIPGGKAVMATEANMAEFEARRAELERQQAEAVAAAVLAAAASAEKWRACSMAAPARTSWLCARDSDSLTPAAGTRLVAELASITAAPSPVTV